MDIWILFQLVFAYSVTLIVAFAKSLVIWGPIGIVVCTALYCLGTRLGWLEKGRIKNGWARMGYGVVLFGLCLPLIAVAGSLSGVCTAVMVILQAQVKEHQLAQPFGSLLIVPAVMAHLVTADNSKAALDELALSAWKSSDVSFLLDKTKRESALRGVSLDFVQYAIKKAQIEKALQTSWLGRLIQSYLEHAVIAATEKKLQTYATLFDTIQPEATGRLSFGGAGSQVGDALFAKTILPYLESMFRAWQLQVFALSAAVWVIALLAIRWLTGKFCGKRQED